MAHKGKRLTKGYEGIDRAYRVVGEQLARLADGRPMLNIIESRGYLPVLTRRPLDFNEPSWILSERKVPNGTW